MELAARKWRIRSETGAPGTPLEPLGEAVGNVDAVGGWWVRGWWVGALLARGLYSSLPPTPNGVNQWGAAWKGSGQEGGQIFYLKMTTHKSVKKIAHVVWPPRCSLDHC